MKTVAAGIAKQVDNALNIPKSDSHHVLSPSVTSQIKRAYNIRYLKSNREH